MPSSQYPLLGYLQQSWHSSALHELQAIQLLPIRVPSKRLVELAGKPWGGKTRVEVGSGLRV